MSSLKRFAAALSLAITSSAAFAVGPFDGLYAFTSVSSSSLLSVHQSGTTLLLVTLGQRPNSLGGAFQVAPSYTVTPSIVSIWEYAIGTITGNEVTVENPGAYYGTCTLVTRVVFDGTGGMTLTPVGGKVTTVGLAAGVNCNTVLGASFGAPGSTTLTLNKVF